jgi:serine/threonine protein kinase
VYKGTDKNGQECAVKIINHDIPQFDMKIVYNEVDILKHVHSSQPHPHIVQIFDFVESIDFYDIQAQHVSSLIIFELLDHGSLQDFIEDFLVYFKTPSHREAVIRSYFQNLIESKTFVTSLIENSYQILPSS